MLVQCTLSSTGLAGSDLSSVVARATQCPVRMSSCLQSNPTFLLELGNLRMVLRKQPLGSCLHLHMLLDREHRVLSALATTAVRVPKPLLMCRRPLCAGNTVLYHGICRWNHASQTQTCWKLGPETAPGFTSRLADTLADLHGLNPAELGLQDFGNPNNYCR